MVLGSGSKDLLSGKSIFSSLRERFQNTDIALCSTAGEIFMDHVKENSLSVTGIQFEKTAIKSVFVNAKLFDSGFGAGVALINKLPHRVREVINTVKFLL